MIKKLLFTFIFCFSYFAHAVETENNQFALSLFSQLEDKEENIVFSPYSIFSNLALLSCGAEGKTRAEMKKTLQISGNHRKFLDSFYATSEKISLDIANGLFPNHGTCFCERFQQIASNIFKAQLQPVNYAIPSAAIETINQWVAEKTSQKIKSLVEESDIDTSTHLVIANAVYFEGKWSIPFAIEKTKSKPFYPNNADAFEVDMVTNTNTYSYFENEKLQVLTLPLKEKNVDCLLLLPKKEISSLEEHLSWEKVKHWIDHSHLALLNVQIPKFSFSKRIFLNDPLKQLGMETAFTKEAQFSKIDGRDDLILDRVLHQAFFSFNETGITATAATTSHMGLTSIAPAEKPYFSFHANRPFVFMLVDHDSKTILFMGHVMNPGMDANL